MVGLRIRTHDLMHTSKVPRVLDSYATSLNVQCYKVAVILSLRLIYLGLVTHCQAGPAAPPDLFKVAVCG
jgi:hypothetical protein